MRQYKCGLQSWPSKWRAGGALLAAALILTGCTQAAGSRSATSPSTSPGLAHVIQPSIRTGQIYVPPGRSASKGPIGAEPSQSHGLQLNILAGLDHDEPIYNGDFADPFGPRRFEHPVLLCIEQFVLQRRPWRQCAGDHALAVRWLSGRFLGDALPKGSLPGRCPGCLWGPDGGSGRTARTSCCFSTPATVPLGILYATRRYQLWKTTRRQPTANTCARALRPTAGPFVDNSS